MSAPSTAGQEGPLAEAGGLPVPAKKPWNQYRRGRVRELLVRHQLEAALYFVVRSHISRGPADLVALKAGRPPLLIQVRTGIHGLRPAERYELWMAAQLSGGLAILANVTGRPMRPVFWRYADGSSNRERFEP